MAGIVDLVEQLSQSDTVKRIGGQLGVDPDAVGKGVTAAMPLLLSALAKNASTPDGAEALHRALAKDHAGGAPDNVGQAMENADTEDGGKILGHVLGDRQELAQKALARTSGMDAETAGQLLATLAPVVLGALGRMQRKEGLDPASLSQRLGEEVQNARQAAPDLMSLATRLLDRDQDGSILDEVGGFVGKLLGKR